MPIDLVVIKENIQEKINETNRTIAKQKKGLLGSDLNIGIIDTEINELKANFYSAPKHPIDVKKNKKIEDQFAINLLKLQNKKAQYIASFERAESRVEEMKTSVVKMNDWFQKPDNQGVPIPKAYIESFSGTKSIQNILIQANRAIFWDNVPGFRKAEDAVKGFFNAIGNGFKGIKDRLFSSEKADESLDRPSETASKPETSSTTEEIRSMSSSDVTAADLESHLKKDLQQMQDEDSHNLLERTNSADSNASTKRSISPFSDASPSSSPTVPNEKEPEDQEPEEHP